MKRRVACCLLISLMVAGLFVWPAPVSAQDDSDTIAAQAQAVLATEPVYTENFRLDNGDWTTDSTDPNVDPYYDVGTLHLWIGAPNTLGYSLSSWEAGDFYLETDSYYVDGSFDNEFGVIFRYVDENNYYYYSISTDGYYSLNRYVDGEWDTLVEWTQSDQIMTGDGSANWIGVFAVGDRITLLVNGTILETVYDDTFDYGTIGLAVGSFADGGDDIAFDDLSLWDAVDADQVAPSVTPSPASGPAATVATLRRGSPTYADDFSVQSDDWPANSNDVVQFAYENESFHIHVVGEGSIGWSINRRTFDPGVGDFYVETDLTDVAGLADAETGLAFRVVDSDNYYYFTISGAGSYRLYRMSDGEWHTLVDWTNALAIRTAPGATNRLGVLAQGASISLFVNDQLLTTVTDDVLSRGGIGPVVGTFTGAGGDAEIAFDNFSLWSLDPAPVATPAATPRPTARPTAHPTALPLPSVVPTVTPAAAEGDSAAVGAELDDLRLTDPTLNETFRSDNGQWIPSADDVVATSVQDGALHVQVNDSLAYGWATHDVATDDVYVEADASLVGDAADAEYGLVFRYMDENNYYQFTVDDTGAYNVAKTVDGEWASLVDWDSSDAVATGMDTANRLGVLVRGSQIAVVANGTVLAEVEDTDLPTGAIGVYVGSFFDSPAEGAFDNVDVWELPPDVIQ